MNCSVARSLDIVGEWWTLLIVRNIMFGQRRFEAIQADLGIARNILSDRLNTLVAHEVVERVKYQEHPERYEYHLTEKGRDLYPLVMRHTCGEQVAARMVCAACGEPIEFGAVRSKAGPGFRPAVVPPGK